MESGLQADCQRHLVACEECRERFAEVEFLQRTLWLAARAERRQEASPAVEQRLLAALRQEREATFARQSVRQSVGQSVRQSVRWSSSRQLWRSAAVLLLAAGLALTFWALNFREWPTRQAETRSTPDLVAVSPPPVAAEAAHNTPGPAVARVIAEPPRPERLRPVRASRAAALAPVRPSSATTDAAAPAGAALETEEALTDYLLLNPGQRFYPLERGQLIRVMVPRSTLGSFGFPVNPERAMTPVKADLVVGEDGMARAIRFIK